MRSFVDRTKEISRTKEHGASDRNERTANAIRISSPADPFEREADAVADRVLTMPDPARSGALPSPQHRAGGGPALMPKGLLGGTCESAPSAGPEEDEPVLAKHEGAVEAQPAAWRPPREDGGSALPAPARGFFEPRLGHTFADVRVHTDSDAAGQARSINAAAFTVGNHIYVGAGRFAPATDSGRRLLAHELTHVVQQSSGRGPAGRSVLQRYSLNGFPPAEEAAMKTAIPVAIAKVSSCADLSWWGRRMTRLAINDRRYDYEPQLGDCGWTFPGSHYIEIGSSAFNPAVCCDLESTIAHEASHTQLYTEGRARRLECKCFGCSC